MSFSLVDWLADLRGVAHPRRQVSLLAAGLLEGRECEATLAHLERCTSCRREHEELRVLVATLEGDPLRLTEPPIPASVLAARVERAAERAGATSRHEPRWWPVALPAAAAVVAAALIVPAVLDRIGDGANRPPETNLPAEGEPLVSEQALRRIERSLAREQAARYLNDAGDVLVAVTASGPDCDRKDARLDVGAAPERSRALLEKRRLVAEAGGDAVASARYVLDDVEMALRDVAELPSCVKRRDVERVRQRLERQQLLMRIRLMTRELEG